MTKKTTLFLIVAFIAIIIVFGYFYYATYSIGDLTPDNYQYKLSRNINKNVFLGTLTFLNNPAFLELARNSSFRHFGYNRYDGPLERKVVEIEDSVNYVRYFVVYNDATSEFPMSYSVTEWSPVDHTGIIKRDISSLLEHGEFILKRTELIRGDDDLIIKDMGDYYVAGLIIGKSEDPYGIRFEAFKKRKYFRTLFQ